MTDATTPAPAGEPVAAPVPSAADIAAAHALLAQAAAAKPLPDAMAELCQSKEFKAGLAKLSAVFALYPTEPSNDLSYAIMSMNRLVTRYAQG